MTVFSLALLSIPHLRCIVTARLTIKQLQDIWRRLPENILSHNVFKLHPKKASTFIYPLPPPHPHPPLDFHLSAIAAIESGRNLIDK